MPAGKHSIPANAGSATIVSIHAAARSVAHVRLRSIRAATHAERLAGALGSGWKRALQLAPGFAARRV